MRGLFTFALGTLWSVRRLFLFIYQGPRRPWWVTLLLVILCPVCWVLLTVNTPHPWLWMAPYPLVLWWQFVRFAEIGRYERIQQRNSNWCCPVCAYPFPDLTKDHDPRASRCPECGNIPFEVIADAKAKLKQAEKW